MDNMVFSDSTRRPGISDRFIRTHNNGDRIPGVIEHARYNWTPVGSIKLAGGRVRPPRLGDGVRYLKWGNKVIGEIGKNNAVSFKAPVYNKVVALYTRGRYSWSANELNEFLAERIISRDRRDIERILFRLDLSRYTVPDIAEITRGIHPNDLFWIARSKNERLEDVMTDVFTSVFRKRIDLVGDGADSPEGYNIKRYGVYNKKYGIYKQRLNPLTTDVESEIAVSLLAEKLGVPVCPALRIDKDTIFSVFQYNYSKEYIVHFRRLFDGARSDNEYQNLVGVRPQYRDDFARMILLDFITRQDGRHLSNMAIKIGRGRESFYALYDNGRSLFYEDTVERVRAAVNDPVKYSTDFGYAGTYWDSIREIADEYGGIDGLINLDIDESDVRAILTEAGFNGYRFYGALEWIVKALDMVREVSGFLLKSYAK